MNRDQTSIGKPIRNLQSMLHVISKANPDYPDVIPDGVYGPDTAAAVSYFQRVHTLPVTGITDEKTWDIIAQIYDCEQAKVEAATPIEFDWETGTDFSPGDCNPCLYLLQCILRCLSDAYSCIEKPELTGILDSCTEDALCCFQNICGLPCTRKLDKATWKHLALQYPLALSFMQRKDSENFD